MSYPPLAPPQGPGAARWDESAVLKCPRAASREQKLPLGPLHIQPGSSPPFLSCSLFLCFSLSFSLLQLLLGRRDYNPPFPLASPPPLTNTFLQILQV